MRTTALAFSLAALALATSAAAIDLYGVDIGNNNLITIDRDTGQGTVVGPVGVNPLNGLAFDPIGVMYALHPNTGLYTVDLATGMASFVGPFGIDSANVNGLAFDPIDRILYATDNTSNSLYTLNPATGTATLVAKIGGGFSEIEGLGYDNAKRILYGITSLQDRVVTIDTDTGLAAPIPGPGLPGFIWRGLEFDNERFNLVASAGPVLYGIDPKTGSFEEIGIMTGTVQGLAFAKSLPCYADFNNDGTLDLFDFLEFVNAFNAGDAAADCDNTGDLDLFDFLCFTNGFNAGCD
jgi:hypothetical protein